MKDSIQKYLLIPISLVLLTIASSSVYAAGCSPYLGLATINEFFKDRANQANDPDDFVEIKILDSSIGQAITSQWTIQICEDNEPGNNNDNDGCSGQISVGDFTDTLTPWMVLKDGSIGTYINLKTGFDAILLDANGDVIDYFSLDGYSQLEDSGCTGTSLAYDYQAAAPGASDKFIFRSPDGTGDWDNAQSAAADPTEDASNDGGAIVPNLSFSNVIISQGTTTATVTLSLDAASTSIITINFNTIDGTLLAGTDYTSVTTTAAFAIGATSLTFDVPVSAISNLGEFYFFISINTSTAGRAEIANHVGKISVSGNTVPAGFDIAVGGGAANTCNPFTFDLTAVDGSGNPVTGYTGTVIISATTSHGNFSVVTGTNTISPDPDTDDNGNASYIFDALDNGVVTLALSNEHAETLQISVTDSSIPLTSTSTDVTFSDNAFTIVDSDALVAGDNVPVAGRDHNYQIQMIRRDPVLGCGVATGYTGVKPLKMWRTKNVIDPSNADPELAGSSLPDADPGIANGNITFVSGIADVVLATSDIGKFTIELADISNSFADITISGSSAEQTVRPFGLAVTNIIAGTTVNPEVDTPTGDIFTTAGSDFSASVSAVLWDTNDDLDNNGILDAGVYRDNLILPNYAWDTTLSVSATGFEPATGTAGLLNNGNIALADFAAGSATVANLQYTEVGSFTIQASALAYLNEITADLEGDDIIVGRFTPDYFEITPTNGELVNACVPADISLTPFTYIGQPFNYGSVHPSFVLRAMNALDNVTLNYTGTDWAKLSESSVALTEPTADSTQNGADGTTLMAISYTHNPYNITETSGGIFNFEFGNDEFVYDRDANSEISEFNADIDLTITAVIDLDGISTTAAFTLTPGPLAPDPDAMLLRFGRIKMSNVHGSELIDLAMPMFVEYLDSSGSYVINIDDECTAVATANLVITDNLTTTGASTVTVTNPTSDQGNLGVILTAPGGGITGNIIVTPNLLGLADWLQYDWDGDGSYDNPSAMATFGIYSGEDVNIYIQQIYQ